MSFTHLHVHSDFSLLDGIGKEDERAQRAADLGQSALALTDHGTLAGVLYHAEACHRVGVKPIVGIEAYFRPNIEADKAAKNTFGYYHLLLLAKDQVGFKNLINLTSLSYTKDYFYQKPCIDWETLKRHSEGLICSSSCVSGILPTMLLQGDTEGVEDALNRFLGIFGDDFYLETQPHDFEDQRRVNIELLNLSGRKGIPVVAAADVHYPFKDWHDTQDVALMISTQSSVKQRKEDEESGKNYMKFSGETFWLMSEDELRQTFINHHPDIPVSMIDNMIANSEHIADKCEDFNYDKSPKIPKATESVQEAESILREWIGNGLYKIDKTDDPVYLDRIDEELSVMRKLGVLDYFVIVADMVRWAKDQGIRVGPGRGSATGSLVNYLIGITAIDPIGHNLIFERFLNEFRTEIPDIDIDFQDDRRDEVKEYLVNKWGSDYVVDVVAFQSFGLKAVVKDVCRVLDIPFIVANKATQAVPDKTFGWGIKELEENVVEIRSLFSAYPEVKRHAERLVGNIKGVSRHAAAVVVTNKPVRDLIPTMLAKDGRVVTQWSERANAQLISPYGFLKIDCLATDSLTTQQNTIDLIKERHGAVIDFEDPKQFPIIESPYNVDDKVIEAFAKGANLGVFQFASKGIVGLLRQIKPQDLTHIIAANALYRPGTIENNVMGDYAKRKNGLVNWKLPHPSVDKYIGDSYGLMIYQEQVMQIYRELAEDATPAEAATFLKVVSKGIARDLHGKEKLQQYQDKFFSGCRSKGIPQKNYEVLWGQILQMSTYAFNKNHSAGYGLQGYQDQWLKTYYPLEFYANLLNTEDKKIAEIIREAKGFGIRVLPPDINTSNMGFTIDGNNIRFGLVGVKNLGPSAIQIIMEARPFSSFEEIVEKCPKSKLNKRVKESLLKSGCLDSLGGRTEWILNEDAMEKLAQTYTEEEMSAMEKEYIGFSISKRSDIDLYKDLLEETIDSDVDNADEGDEVCVGGEITNVKVIKTKKGDTMAFVELDYFNNSYSLTVFPEKYKKYYHMFGIGNTILALGDWDTDRGTVITSNICTAEQLSKEKNGSRS